MSSQILTPTHKAPAQNPRPHNPRTPNPHTRSQHKLPLPTNTKLLRNSALITATTLTLPIIAVVVLALNGSSTSWQHIANTVLPLWTLNTILLALGVAIGVLLLGVPPAWLVSRYQFPLRKFFEVFLVLPLAVPPYIAALALSWLLDGAGPVQSFVRTLTNASGEVLPPLHSLPGAILLLSFAFYPYVYLLARKAFLGQNTSTLEVAQCLGTSPRKLFQQVALPIARPALVVGVALALMETLAEYGALHLLGVHTWTTAIFHAWFSFGDLTAAARLSCLLLLVVALLLTSEQLTRRQRSFSLKSNTTPLSPKPLHKHHATLAVFICATPPLIGFALPASTLAFLALNADYTHANAADQLFSAVRASALLGLAAVLLILPTTLLIAYALRSSPARKAPAKDPLAFWRGSPYTPHRSDPLGLLAARTVSLGYATPGAVIAIGTIACFTSLDAWLRGRDFGLEFSWITLSVGGLLFAYMVRFATIALETIDAGLVRIRPSLDDAARGLGRTELQTLIAIHIPLLLPSLFTAALIVFVEVLKELPATLLIRPFGLQTLAAHAWSLADDERLTDAAPAALLIVVTGLLPVVLLLRMTRRQFS